MKKLAALLPVALLVPMFAAGCWGRGNCPVVTNFVPADGPAMTTTPVDADYLLYAGNSTDPIARHHLKAGEPIGFKLNAVDTMGKPVGPKGSVSAVAGEMAFPISATETYEWKRLPSSSKSNKEADPYLPRP